MKRLTYFLLAAALLLYGDSYSGRSLPYRVGGANLTSSGVLSGSSTIGPVTVITPATAGLYRFGINSFLTTQGAGGTWVSCFITNNGTASITTCGATSNFNGTIGTTESNANGIVKWCAAGQAIQFQISVTSASGSPVIMYAYNLERLQ